MKAIAIYKGRRISQRKRLIHVYQISKRQEDACFAKKLLGFENVGTTFEVEIIEGKSFKTGELLDTSEDTKHQILEWSTKEAEHVTHFNRIKIASKKAPEHLDNLIKQLKAVSTFADRRELALYVYTKLLF